MEAKRDALAAFLLPILQAHDSRYRLETEVQPATRFGNDAHAVRSLMGTPILYAEAIYVSDNDDADATRYAAGGRARQVGDSFVVNVWREIETASQAKFDAIWKATTSPEGIATTLWRTRVLAVSGRGAQVSPPRNTQAYEVSVIQGGGRPRDGALRDNGNHDHVNAGKARVQWQNEAD